MTLDELIKKLEKATGPDRYLDAKIAEALGWRVSSDNWWNVCQCGCSVPLGDEWCIRRDGRKDIPCNEALPNFTSSIDAAITLVPSDCWWDFSPFSGAQVGGERFSDEFGSLPIFADHRIPAIALCIAALRARKEGDASNENAG